MELATETDDFGLRIPKVTFSYSQKDRKLIDHALNLNPPKRPQCISAWRREFSLAPELPVEDVRRYDVILALRRNGEYMPVQNRGPLFIVYNFDSDPELKNQKFYSRSVWHIAKLEVR